MALAAPGLAKIVRAVDIILSMDLPQSSPEALHREGGQWRDVMAATELIPGNVQRVGCDGRGLFVHAEGDDLRVYDSRCPQQSTEIPHLALQGHTQTRPKHEWAFDLRSAACVKKGNSALRRWPARLQGDRLRARW